MLDSVDKKWNKDRPTLYYVIDKKKGGVVAQFKVSLQKLDTLALNSYLYS